MVIKHKLTGNCTQLKIPAMVITWNQRIIITFWYCLWASSIRCWILTSNVKWDNVTRYCLWASSIISAGIENISRGNLNYLEEGEYYHNLLKNKVLRSQQEIADTFGVSRQIVTYKTQAYHGLLPILANVSQIIGNETANIGNFTSLIPLTHALELRQEQ